MTSINITRFNNQQDFVKGNGKGKRNKSSNKDKINSNNGAKGRRTSDFWLKKHNHERKKQCKLRHDTYRHDDIEAVEEYEYTIEQKVEQPISQQDDAYPGWDDFQSLTENVVDYLYTDEPIHANNFDHLLTEDIIEEADACCDMDSLDDWQNDSTMVTFFNYYYYRHIAANELEQDELVYDPNSHRWRNWNETNGFLSDEEEDNN